VFGVLGVFGWLVVFGGLFYTSLFTFKLGSMREVNSHLSA